MDKRTRDELNIALRDISAAGSILKPDHDRDAALQREPVKAGPNQWPPQVGDFGAEQDYTVVHLGLDRVAICADCNAALQWCYRFLPEWLDRYRDNGFIIERKWMDFVCGRMKESGLMSFTEFNEAMAEADEQATQWETTEE